MSPPAALRRISAGALAVAAACAATYASAASLGGLPTAVVGAGDAAIPACDASFTVGYTTSHGNVTSATVGDVADPACEGGQVRLTLVNAAGSAIGSGGPTAVAPDGDSVPNSVSVAVSPEPAAEQVAAVRVSVVGP